MQFELPRKFELKCDTCEEFFTVEIIVLPRYCPACGNPLSEFLEQTTAKKIEHEKRIQHIWDYYCEKIGKEFAQFSAKRKRYAEKCFQYAMKQSKQDVKKATDLMEIAIDELAASDFHNARGRYKGQPKYNDFDHVFRTIEQFEKWLNRSAEN